MKYLISIVMLSALTLVASVSASATGAPPARGASNLQQQQINEAEQVVNQSQLPLAVQKQTDQDLQGMK